MAIRFKQDMAWTNDRQLVLIEQSGNVTVEAEGTLKLKASTIEISGDTTVKIAGQTVNLN